MGVLLAAAAVVELFDGMEMVLFTEGTASLVVVAKGLSCPCFIVLVLFRLYFFGGSEE
jgi:hypothetical protein